MTPETIAHLQAYAIDAAGIGVIIGVTLYHIRDLKRIREAREREFERAAAAHQAARNVKPEPRGDDAVSALGLTPASAQQIEPRLGVWRRDEAGNLYRTN